MSETNRYRKKPVEIEARQVPRLDQFDEMGAVRFVDNVVDLADWCGGRSHMVDPPEQIVPGIYIETLEGEMRADPGDWIIRGVQGEFYPCKPDIFEATYEPVTPLIPGDPIEAPGEEQ